MRTRTRFALGVLLAALLPLVIAAGVSMVVSRRTAEKAVTQGNLNTALQAAARIDSFLKNQEGILAALSQTVASSSHLTDRQIEAVLRNHVLEFAFHELAVYDLEGKERMAVRRGPARAHDEEPSVARAALGSRMALGSYYIADDLQPGVALGVPILGLNGPEGALVAQVDLVELWRLVDQIRVGDSGYALITDADGRVLAAGVGKLKAKALLGERVPEDTGLVATYASGKPAAGTRGGALGLPVVGAEVPLPSRRVIVSVEQPTSEAFADAAALGGKLGLVALLAGAFGLLVSLFGSRRPLRAIADLTAATRRVAAGDFHARAAEHGDDELAHLAHDFNQMTIHIRELTAELRRHERLSVFARVAAGLAHDLKHPIKNLENQARLLLEVPDDPRFRETFRRSVERDFGSLDRFLASLHDLTQTPTLQPVALDPRTLAEAVAEGVLGQAQTRGIAVSVDVPSSLPRFEGDRITLERALTNLLINAIEASASGTVVRLVGTVEGAFVTLSVVDQGPGIPPDRRERLFEEFATTKRSGKGLGLGLALSARFVREQGGSIECDSEVGKGSTFRILMPLRSTILAA